MDPLLTDAWFHGLDPLPTIDIASVSVARERVRELGVSLGLDQTTIESVAVAASELVHNQLRHARRGQLAVRGVERDGIPGIEIIAADLGRGIADPVMALEGPGPSSTSLGSGLSGARRMTHEMDVDVRSGEGTCVRARRFAEPVRRRREVGILGRPCEHESESGDHAAFVRDGDSLVVAVVDGVGHGPLAREASMGAVAAFLAHAGSSPAAILDASDAAVASTRGAVMSVARIDASAGEVEHAAVGNVVTRIERYRASRILSGVSGTLGARGVRRKPHPETVALDRTEVLMLYSDGVSSRVDLSSEPDLLREHSLVIAQRIMAKFSRANDDALVLVAR